VRDLEAWKKLLRRGVDLRIAGHTLTRFFVDRARGPTVERLRREGRLSIEIIDGPDHTFTPLWSHPVLTSTLAAHFDDLPRART
jgi:hypothetical protein